VTPRRKGAFVCSTERHVWHDARALAQRAREMEAIEMMKLTVAVITMGGLLLLGAGCSKEEEKKEGAAASGDSIGVAECDEYIAKYQKCIDKMPAAAKTTAEQGFKTQRDAWRTAASTPQGKEGLKTGCKMALDSLANNALCK
jgi:hypothetical protein